LLQLPVESSSRAHVRTREDLRRASGEAVTSPKLVPEDGPAGEVATVGQNGSRDPATVRPRLAEAAAEGLEGIRKTLLDAATGAVRDHWITFECGECGARKRIEVPVPDVRARVAAIELLLREGLGRPGVAEEPPVLRLPASSDAVEAMPWSDMKALFASMFVDEIAAVRRDGGDAHLRDRVLALSPDDRKTLRAVLAEVPR
jgi:hypothetical protein